MSQVQRDAGAKGASVEELLRLRPAQIAQTREPGDLNGHFILTRNRQHIPTAWSTEVVEGWTLGWSGLPVRPLLTENGEPAGWILGMAIDPDAGEVVEEGQQVERVVDRFEDLCGRFVLLRMKGGRPRVYLDPIGAMSVVYAPSAEIVASCPNLIPYCKRTVDAEELIDALEVPARNGIFPFGLTPRHGIYRLLPNFFLDLGSWKAERHWPMDGFPAPGPDAVREAVVRTPRQIIEAFPEEVEFRMGLTAGADSRCLLACYRERAERFQFFTTSYPNLGGEIDVDVASRIARREGLRHEVVRCRGEPDTEMLVQRLYATGCAVGEGQGMLNFPAWKKAGGVQGERAVVSVHSHGAELDKYWRQGTDCQQKVSVDELLRRLRLPRDPMIQGAADWWLRTVPIDAPSGVWGLVHIEQRLGCWLGVLGYCGLSGYTMKIRPFASRRIFEQRLGYGFENETGNRSLVEAIVEHIWPELNKYPINRPISARLKMKCGWSEAVSAPKRWKKRGKRFVRRRLPAGLVGVER